MREKTASDVRISDGSSDVCASDLDGQWFLKIAARLGREEAMRLNERAIASLARIELREFKRATGIDSLDAMEQVAEWYRLIRYLFNGWGQPDRTESVRASVRERGVTDIRELVSAGT